MYFQMVAAAMYFPHAFVGLLGGSQADYVHPGN